ncbi:hypothetical protein [Actinokineospora sp.]|uniref:hypothetical protein n=1 Tax=Actinokineospora sp. TaxID=1872133 RepID=UPI004037B681
MTADPAARYRALLDTAHQAARRHTDHERRRMTELVGEVARTDKDIKAAAAAEEQVGKEINDWWRQVATAMAGLRWITAGPAPAADSTADPDALPEYLAEVEPATHTLTVALRRAAWPRKL